MPNPASPAFLDRLRASLPEGRVRAPEPRYLEEPRGRFVGQAAALVTPATTGEVAATLRLAAEAHVGIVPYGGGTGLVGGQVAPDGPAPVILSLERMSAIRGIWPEENVLIAEAGATVAEIQKAAEAA
jgi:FAD/FMN-containing dehydrogenase